MQRTCTLMQAVSFHIKKVYFVISVKSLLLSISGGHNFHLHSREQTTSPAE